MSVLVVLGCVTPTLIVGAWRKNAIKKAVRLSAQGVGVDKVAVSASTCSSAIRAGVGECVRDCRAGCLLSLNAPIDERYLVVVVGSFGSPAGGVLLTR